MSAIPEELDPRLFQSSFTIDNEGGGNQGGGKKEPPKASNKLPKTRRRLACIRCNAKRAACVVTNPADQLSTCQRCERLHHDCTYPTSKEDYGLNRYTRQQLIEMVQTPHLPAIPHNEQERMEMLEDTRRNAYPAWVDDMLGAPQEDRLALRAVLTTQLLAVAVAELTPSAASVSPSVDSSTSATLASTPTSAASATNASASTMQAAITWATMGLSYTAFTTTNFANAAHLVSTATDDDADGANDTDSSEGTGDADGDVDMEN